MSDTTTLIKERLDIVDFIKQYVTLSPAGKNFKGSCPFHKEKTPSFIVSPDRQIWHCFGCGAGGDAISFLMRYENIEFFEALKILGEKSGVDVHSGSSDQKRFNILYDINKAAKEFFKANLQFDSASAKAARQYLLDRGLNSETIKEFNIGIAPNASDFLAKHLVKSGFKMQEIERAGVVLKTERGTYWDRFRNRIMFPLQNHFGKDIGFTGRIMPSAEETASGKYINSPETPIFNKSKLLFGFNKSKNAIRESKSAVVVEGQMDFLLCWQDGIKNIVATSGTAPTKEHLKAIKRLADNLVVAYDNDEAGQIAAERLIDLAGEYDFNVRVLNQELLNTKVDPKAKDPADIVINNPGLMVELVRNSEPAMHYYFNRYLGVYSFKGVPPAFKDIANLKKNIRIVLSKIKNIVSPVERSHWLKQLSDLVNISESQLMEEMGLVKSDKYSVSQISESKSEMDIVGQNFARRDLIAQRLISLAIANSDFKKGIEEYFDFLAKPYRQVGKFLTSSSKIALTPDLKELADLISLRSSFELNDKAEMRREFNELGRNLKLEYYKEQRETLSAKIKQAEASGDEKMLAESLREFDRISKEIYSI